MPEKSNIPSELQSAGSRPLQFEPQDADTAKEVNAFLQQKNAEVGGEPITEGANPQTAPEEITETVRVPPNPEFDNITPHDAAVSDALATEITVVVTDMEKEVFLKSVLNDEPVRLPVELFGGKFKVEFRSRSVFEQRRVFDAIELDRTEKVIPPDNVSLMVTRMQQYLAVLMIERINGKEFSDLVLDPKGKLEEHVKQLRDKVSERMEGMVGVRWNSLLSALRTFENKCAKLNTEALNEGFWKPQGSVS